MEKQEKYNLNKKTVAIISAGSFLEWAEYSIYSYMVNIIAKIFFPANIAAEVAILQAFAIFSLSYISRPLGALAFGYIGDKHGRKPALILSVMLMSFATLTIGLLPSYASVGVMSTVMLLMMRILQSFSLSGEYNGAAIYLIEKTTVRKCFTGSIISSFAALGLTTGAIVSAIIDHPGTPEWAWRVPFIASGLACFLLYFFRKQLTETEEFNKSSSKDNNYAKEAISPITDALSNYKPQLIYIMLISGIIGAFFYVNNVFFKSFLINEINLTAYDASLYVILGQLLTAISIPFVGYYSDKINYLKLFKFGILFCSLISPVIFFLGSIGTPISIISAELLYALGGGLSCGSLMRVMYDRFPAKSRYTGNSFAWAVGAALLSGSAPTIVQYLTMTFEYNIIPGIYIFFLGMMCLIIMEYIDRNYKY